MLISIIIICSLAMTALPDALAESAEPAGPASEYMSLQDFLDEFGMTLGDYISVAAEFENSGTYPHYLEKNAARYDAFSTANPGIPESTAIAYVNVNVDFGPYNDIQDVPGPEWNSMTMLVNKNFCLPENWSVDDIIDIGAGYLFREEAAGYLIDLRDTMRAAGMRMFPVSTYRTYASSLRLYNNALSSYGREVADLNWARAGHSEHHTGLAADILQRTDSPTLTEARFEQTAEYEWMKENAHNYGFILRYPEAYEDIHGYKFEPWHWRYVGVEIATAMFEENIAVYEEFYGKYLVSDVLINTRNLIYEQIERAEAEERERLEREAAELQAAVDAARAEEEARLAEEARVAAELEAARVLREEQERIAELERQAAEEEAAQGEMMITLIVTAGFAVAMICTIIGAFFLDKKKRARLSQPGRQV